MVNECHLTYQTPIKQVSSVESQVRKEADKVAPKTSIVFNQMFYVSATQSLVGHVWKAKWVVVWTESIQEC